MTSGGSGTVPVSRLAPAAADALVSLADDELMMGHRHAEWLGLSPFLEEDLTSASIAQDELGHARAIYELVWPSWDGRDAHVVRRPPGSWRCTPLTVMRGEPWERSLVRHWVYDTIEPARWAAVVEAHGHEVDGLCELAERVEREERFHRAHAGSLMERLCSVASAAKRLQGQLTSIGPVLSGTWPLLGATGADARRRLRTDAAALGLVLPADGASVWPGHGADLADALASLTEVFAFDPEARW
jgi:ring-1,2-phenylacetyl-CoA epoxidase subunit PaaC